MYSRSSVSRSVVSDSLRPHGLEPSRLLCPKESSGKDTEVGCRSLLQGIFPNQGLNPSLLHCRQMVYCLRHQGSPGRLVGLEHILKLMGFSSRLCAGLREDEELG